MAHEVGHILGLGHVETKSDRLMFDGANEPPLNLISSEGSTTIVGTFLHFYGIEVLVTGANDVITIREVSSTNETIQYASNIQSVLVDAGVATSTSLNNGTHLLSAPITTSLQFTLDNGIIFLAS